MSVRFPVDVYLALGADITADPSTWTWTTDITEYVHVRDGGIRITRGRQNEQSQSQPSSCTLLLNNGDGRFSRLNPVGAYYGQLTKNTPIRVRANPGGGLVTRFVGFVSEWPVQWDKSGNDFWVNVRADGVMRRLGQGGPLRSFVYRQVRNSVATQTYMGYWPLEDDAGATRAASGLDGGSPMSVAGSVAFGSITPPSGSSLLPDFTGGGRATGNVRLADGSDGWIVAFTLVTASAAGGEDAKPVQWQCASGQVTWYVDVTTTQARLHTIDESGTSTQVTTVTVDLYDGETHWIRVTASQSGSNISATLAVDDDSNFSSVASATIDAVTSVTVNPDGQTDGGWTAVGHVLVSGDAVDSTYSLGTVQGVPGQDAATRFAQVASMEDVSTDVAIGDSEEVGAYPIASLLTILRQCEAVDGGVMVERRTGELGLDLLDSRINLATSLTLDYASQHIDALAPTDDDLLTGNKWTITRLGGSSATAEQADGPLGTDPITGAGRYEKSATLNLYTDQQATDHAAWRAHIDTVNEYRYPRLQVKLHNSRLSALVDSIAAVDISDRITVTNLPANMPPDDVDLMVEGYTEVINSFEWTIAFNCSPYAPYFVFTLDDDVLGRLQTSGSELGIGIDSDDTSLTVVTLADYRPWINSTDHSAQFPFHAWLGGEVVTVTAIAGSTSPQTFTVTRSVNSVTKAHSAGTSVRVARVGA